MSGTSKTVILISLLALFLEKEEAIMIWKLLPFRKRKSDDEFIAGIRRNIEAWDRWRYGRILLSVSLVAAWIWVLSLSIRLILKLDQQEVESMALFWGNLGMLIGFAVGFLGSVAFSYLAILSAGFRSERLLLKYYDAQNSPEQSEDEESQA
ncbi:hypothetical protein [Gimesia alba]|nr:hypothetical protein [Gimesia alba]